MPRHTRRLDAPVRKIRETKGSGHGAAPRRADRRADWREVAEREDEARDDEQPREAREWGS